MRMAADPGCGYGSGHRRNDNGCSSDQAAQLAPSRRAPRTHGVDIQPAVDWAQSSACSPRAFMRNIVYGESLDGLSDLMDDPRASQR